MTWYTASIILSCRLQNGEQDVFPVYENFTLFEAENRKDALKKATAYAEEYANIDDQLQLNGEPAYWEFEGIRKLVEIRDHLSEDLDIDAPGDGTEVSYSYYEVDSIGKLKDIASGGAVYMRYVDAADD